MKDIAYDQDYRASLGFQINVSSFRQLFHGFALANIGDLLLLSKA